LQRKRRSKPNRTQRFLSTLLSYNLSRPLTTRRKEWNTSNFPDRLRLFVVKSPKLKVFSLPCSFPKIQLLSFQSARVLNSRCPHDFPLPFLHRALELHQSRISRFSNPYRKELVSVSPVSPSAVLYELTDIALSQPVGSVYLAKKVTTGDYYAIKVLKKSDMVAKNQVTNVKAERMILMTTAESNFVVKLYYTFQSKDYLYLVMEYLNGGDCGALVKNLGGLTEDWAKKYVAEVVVGLEHLHSSGIIHR
jgi:hypothetical protein